MLCNAQTIVNSVASLSGFTYSLGAGPSSQQSFTVSGSSLSAGISITASSDYEISAVSGTYFTGTNSLTISKSGTVVNLTTIYVRLKTGLVINNYNGSITLSSTGAVSKNITLSGKVNNSTIGISTSTTSLAEFNYVIGSGPSGEKSFTVSGTSLSGNISIVAPTNFEISTGTGALFVGKSSISLIQNGGNVPTTTIYVRLKSGLSVNSYLGNINLSTISGLGTTISLSGSVSESPIITVSTKDISGLNYMLGIVPTTVRSFTVNGSTLSSDITITPPTNFQISLTSNASYVSTPIILTNIGGNVSSRTIYVRLISGLPLNTYSESISLTSNGAIAQSILCSGEVTSGGSLNVSTSSMFLTQNDQSFNVSGYGLTSTVIVLAPTNIVISTESSYNFNGSNQILLSPSSSKLTETPIYIRLKEGSANGNGNITILSTDVATKSISISTSIYYTGTSNLKKEVAISTLKNQIRINGLSSGEEIKIYNTKGILVKSFISSSGENIIRINENGLYILKYGNNTKKVIL